VFSISLVILFGDIFCGPVLVWLSTNGDTATCDKQDFRIAMRVTSCLLLLSDQYDFVSAPCSTMSSML